MKLNKMSEMSVQKKWNEICVKRKREKRPPRNQHAMTAMRIRDLSCWRQATNRLHHEAAG